MILLFYFFLLDLNELGFEELGTFNGVDFVVAYNVGTIIYFNA
jgi:hypothetical protein